MTHAQTALIDMWIDVICPWCLIALTRLNRAAGTLGMEPQIRLRAFRLHRDWPAHGMSWRDFQVVRNLPDAVFDHVAAVGRSDGLNFDFRRIARVPETTGLHLALIAAARGGSAVALYRALAEAYFFNEADLSDPTTVIAAAAQAGLSRDMLDAAFGSPAIGRILIDDEREASSLGVRGVPFLRFGDLTVAGAQPVAAYAQLLREPVQSAV